MSFHMRIIAAPQNTSSWIILLVIPHNYCKIYPNQCKSKSKYLDLTLDFWFQIWEFVQNQEVNLLLSDLELHFLIMWEIQ